ncbi:ankyrin repeat domain-containing protein [Flavobacterium cerinum]|uniref:Ankyrin repeat domain-containing protein n=1 Tax=Flavobacterium cerinum TaxID=2502784 RepID=A0ABY5IMQ0_9FLAO|nr:ankyrin repeat domain-containing protein [Flavobacterium cerinum]UUC44116.1 ankyrin repeat domain-containing protein [Flavobacterium cerinum]
MAQKRKTLPKDFEELLKKGDIQELIQLFDKCEIEARGGYSKGTALSFAECPHELAKWLVEQGADIEASNDYSYTPLQERSGRRFSSNIKSLLELGANVNANNSRGTALHCAARNHNTENIKILLEYGADIKTIVSEGYGEKRNDYTALELALMNCRNIDIEDTLEISKILLHAGTPKTEKMKAFVTGIGKMFEHHRPNFYDESTEQTSDALDELYRIFEVEPVPRRIVYDGKSPITVKATTWQKQHEELWELLVPGRGAAQTVQGEVIRITGKVARELLDNGGGNWDIQYQKMVDGYFKYIQQENQLSPEEIKELTIITNEVKAKNSENIYVMSELGVKWVLNNPTPIALTVTDYDR